MVKIKLKGGPETQYQIGDSFVAGGSIVDLSESLIKKHKDIVLERLEKSESNIPIKEPVKKRTKTQIKNLDKEEQIELLKNLGVKEIPRLEKDRVDAILKAQEIEVRE